MSAFIKTVALSMGIFSALFFISCNEDGDGGDNPAYDFKDQNLQGKIDGIEFSLGEGTVETSEGELSFDLLSDLETESACELFGFGDFVRVFFNIPEAEGLVELSFDFSTFDGQTVTMFNPDGSLNVIATEGAVEITEITETSVSGRMDIQYDGDNFVNKKNDPKGSFNVSLQRNETCLSLSLTSS